MEQKEILAMLVVIYKRLDKIERAQRGSTLMASDQHYLDELREKAHEIMNQIL